MLTTDPDLLLGLDPATACADHSVERQPGSTVLLSTDGLVEPRGVSIDDGLAWLLAVTQGRQDSTPDQLCDVLLEAVVDTAEDDIALLVMRARPEGRPLPGLLLHSERCERPRGRGRRAAHGTLTSSRHRQVLRWPAGVHWNTEDEVSDCGDAAVTEPGGCPLAVPGQNGNVNAADDGEPGEVSAVRVELAQDQRAPRQARRAIRDALVSWRLCGLVDAVVLTASELVTNALRHGRPPVSIELQHSMDRVRLEVHDGDPSEPPAAGAEAATTAESGRGISIVHALADDVAVQQVEDDGKIVHATFEVDRQDSRPH